MPRSSRATEPKRPPLSKERVLVAAVELADRGGIEPLTIRKLAAELDAKPMTLYHHVANKEEILDGMVDRVFDEIDLPPQDMEWRSAVRQRSLSAREALGRHPWAIPMMESRTSPGPATLRHHDAMLGCFRRGGLSLEMAAHAYALIDSFVYGFALQEASLPSGGSEEIGEFAGELVEAMRADEYPHLVEFTTEHVMKPGYSFANTFEFGLDLLLDGLVSASAPNAPSREVV